MMLKTKLGYMYESYLEGIDKVTAKDDHTVVITTKEPKANMLMNTTPILPEHIWSKISEKDLEDYTNDKAIGSGPYKFVAQSDDGAIKLELNSDYYRDKGNVKYFVFTQYKNTDSLAQALKTGEIDAAVNLSATQYSQLQKDKNVKVISGEVLGFMIEPSRLAPKPRRTNASCVPPSVLVCTTLLTLYSASSSVVA